MFLKRNLRAPVQNVCTPLTLTCNTTHAYFFHLNCIIDEINNVVYGLSWSEMWYCSSTEGQVWSFSFVSHVESLSSMIISLFHFTNPCPSPSLCSLQLMFFKPLALDQIKLNFHLLLPLPCISLSNRRHSLKTHTTASPSSIITYRQIEPFLCLYSTILRAILTVG